jgi:hypothetical protein
MESGELIIDKALVSLTRDMVQAYHNKNYESFVDIFEERYETLSKDNQDMIWDVIVTEQGCTVKDMILNVMDKTVYKDAWISESGVHIWEVELEREIKEAFDKNVKQSRESSDGQDEYLTEGVNDIHIGLFWYFNGEIQIEYSQHTTKKDCLMNASENEIYLTPIKSDHIKMWYEVYNRNTKTVKDNIIEKYGNVEYDHYPRGRVLYYVNKKIQKHNYLVMLDPCILNDKVVRDKIIKSFDIDGNVEFATDEHYSCKDCR